MSFSIRPRIRLRGHHLICLHFFNGEGYDYEFIENLRKILERAWSGEKIKICSGADDICRKCPHLKGEMCYFDRDADQEIRKMDRRAIKLLRLSAQGKVDWSEIRDKIPAVIKEWADTYCKACGWKKACKETLLHH
jgi:hypothetical protein